MGHIHVLHDFYAPEEQRTRTLRIYTPDAYHQQPERRFGVLYMLDGQNVFDDTRSALYHTWRANHSMEWLAAEGRIDPWIIVAIDHFPERFEEYSPWPFPIKGIQGRGHALLQTLVKNIKPYVDTHYRTIQNPVNTAIMGASLGGLMALYMGRERPDVFGRIGGVSPTLNWCDYRSFWHWDSKFPVFSKIWLCCGSDERFWLDNVFLDYTHVTEDFYRHLRGLGYGEHEVVRYCEPNAGHHEIDWQRRFPTICQWLLERVPG